mgnify:CR=1 FL=1
MKDCEAFFGKFLHHFPYWGMRGDDDAKDLQDSFARTLELYESTIGPVPDSLWKAAGRCPNCGVGSKCVSLLFRPSDRAYVLF